MPKSRGRRPRRSGKRSTQWKPPRDRRAEWQAEWQELQPWARAMVRADEAEARGDAFGALEVIGRHAEGPDGEFFWRPWRVKHLAQIATLGPFLPRWVTSRWILNQAMQALHEGNRRRADRAFQTAVDLRGGADGLPGVDEVDAFSRVVDRDWVYRQVFLYELGGLEFFVRQVASPDLLVGADSMHEWARTPMGGYRLVGSEPAAVTWLDLATEGQVSVPNIGCAVFVRPGEHVIGRLAPIEGGVLFETQPLLVTEQVAQQVAQDPAEWLAALRAARTSPGEVQIVTSGRHHHSLVSDVPSLVWELAVLDEHELLRDPAAELDAGELARAVLDVARQELETWPRERAADEIDLWPCLGAALLESDVLGVLPDVVRRPDRDTLHQLSGLLAEPAASLCRELVGHDRGAA